MDQTFITGGLGSSPIRPRLDSCHEVGVPRLAAVTAVAKLLSLISLALDGPLFPIASANLNADPALAF